MARLLTFFSLLLFCTVAAAMPAPFPCEAKKGVDISKLRPELQQWFFLFDLTKTLESESASSLETDASFKSNYWQGLHEVQKMVQNCDHMIAFWQKFGESIEIFFDQIKPVGADLSNLSQSVLTFEMQKREKIKPPSTNYPLEVIFETTDGPLLKPWWNVETRAVEYMRIFKAPHTLYRERGPLGALFSYEILRQWQRHYPNDFWFANVVLTNERAHILALTFPWGKSIFQLLTRLPARDILSNYLNYFCLILSIPFVLRLFWAFYRDFLAKKQK